MGGDYEGSEFVFYRHNNARLKYSRRRRKPRSKTAKDSEVAIGFFLCTPSIPVYGCGLLACFGMGGWETLIWNRIVRTRYSDWVSRPLFVVGQFDLKGRPENPPTLAFADEIKAEILLQHKIVG